MSAPKIDFASLKKNHWSETEQKHAAIAIDFVQSIMNDHDFEAVLSKFGNHSYIQHNPTMPDGIQGLVGYLRGFVKTFPEFSYDVKSIMVDGDLVSIHSHATLKRKDRGNQRKGLNIKDTWRIENGVLTEHWDAVQPIDMFMRIYGAITGGKTLNKNGFF
ncbi:MAG: nuclear transport factor 2 family protein [Pseudobacteriovorax sp.]|nr:nuclear transport factor 2 family protein [Pseudobacteriovorax sp.]